MVDGIGKVDSLQSVRHEERGCFRRKHGLQPAPPTHS